MQQPNGLKAIFLEKSMCVCVGFCAIQTRVQVSRTKTKSFYFQSYKTIWLNFPLCNREIQYITKKNMKETHFLYTENICMNTDNRWVHAIKHTPHFFSLWRAIRWNVCKSNRIFWIILFTENVSLWNISNFGLIFCPLLASRVTFRN